MKFGFSHYHAPTPAKMRKFGDALLGAGVTIQAATLATEYVWVGFAGLALCVAGKFLTNFFSDETTTPS